jgi:hypothetical protein
MVITPKSLTITQLLSGESEQYVVPAYQRRYSWREKQLWEFLEDISLLEGSDTHLLGSIVCLTGFHTAGINKLEIVDGQQRLTTICILLQCIADRFKKEGETGATQDIDRLLQAKALGEPAVRKILLDSLDSAEFEQHLLGKTVDAPGNHNLNSAFSLFRGWAKTKQLSDLGTFVYHLKNQCVVIRLDVSDAKDAFKLFETINNRGLRLSPTDIIKNFIFGNAARFGPDSLALARAKWAELLRHLDGTSLESFFRNFLCAKLRRRITISFVIPNFKMLFMQQVSEAKTLPDRHWYFKEEPIEEEPIEEEPIEEVTEETEPNEGQQPQKAETSPRISFAEFMEQIVVSAKVYGQVARGDTGHVAIDRHLRNLRMIKSLQTYGFLMALRAGGCSDNSFVDVLKLTEALVLRRHICRERTNETERLFARLSGINCTNPLSEVIEEFRRFCPSDERFEHDFSGFDFTSNLIERARYCLEQFELTRQGEHLELLISGPDTVHVEHIIPLKIKPKKAKEEYGDWPSYLGPGSEARHPDYVARIGNLTLFAGKLNIGASNNPYDRKKTAYMNSAIKLTNTLPSEFPEFRFEQVDSRSADLAKLAVMLWPMR